MADVFYADVDALLNVSIADYLVNDNANSVRGDIIHNSGPSVEHIRGLTMLKVTRTDPW